MTAVIKSTKVENEERPQTIAELGPPFSIAGIPCELGICILNCWAPMRAEETIDQDI